MNALQVKKLSNALEKRRTKLKAVRNGTAHALSLRFGRYLRARGHIGSVNVDWREQRLIFRSANWQRCVGHFS